MPLSYSFHISGKGHAITSASKLSSVGKHNLRKYKSADYDSENIISLRGSNDLVGDVKEIYQQEFELAKDQYNAKQKRTDRKIKDYFKHTCENSKSDVAVEIIIQVGDKDFWEDKTIQQKRKMDYIFKDQLNGLEKLLPEFKIANATIHYDESSPHMHIVGVPVKEGYQKGMKKQVCKTGVFTKESLEMLQDKMRERAEKGVSFNADVFNDTIREKSKGRNYDLSKEYYIKQKELQNISSELTESKLSLDKANSELENTKKEIGTLNGVKSFLKGFIDRFKEPEIDKSSMSPIQLAIMNETDKHKTLRGHTKQQTISLVEQAQSQLDNLSTPSQSHERSR